MARPETREGLQQLAHLLAQCSERAGRVSSEPAGYDRAHTLHAELLALLGTPENFVQTFTICQHQIVRRICVELVRYEVDRNARPPQILASSYALILERIACLQAFAEGDDAAAPEVEALCRALCDRLNPTLDPDEERPRPTLEDLGRAHQRQCVWPWIIDTRYRAV